MKNSNSNAKIQFVSYEQIDFVKWDELVERQGEINVYCFSWYLNAVCDRWNAVVFGDYETVFPLPEVVKGGQSIIYQPFFTQLLLMAGRPLSAEQKLQFIQAIPDKYKLVHFSLPCHIDLESSWRIEKVAFQELLLNQSYEDLKKSYSENTRRQLKKAKKAGVTIQSSGDYSTFVQLFKQQVGEGLGFTDENYVRLERLMMVASEKGIGELIVVQLNDEVVAAGFFLIQDHRVLYLKGAVSDEGKKMGAMFYLLDAMIHKYANSKKVFDFGGSKVESVAQFYKKFGGGDCYYYNYSRNTLPWLLKKAKELRDNLKK